VNLIDRSSEEIVLAQLPDALTHFNEVHPDSLLKRKSPRIFRMELARRAQENAAD
jgi:putative transposase